MVLCVCDLRFVFGCFALVGVLFRVICVGVYLE